MSNDYTDGFFFHPDGRMPADISKRIASESINPRLDDLFSIAIQETKQAQKANDARKTRLLARLDAIEAEIARIDIEQTELEARLVSQHRAVDSYQCGEDISEADRELLTPKCVDLVHDAKKKLAEDESALCEPTIPDGWELDSKRHDEEYLYVTIKRKREHYTSPQTTVMGKIKQAIDRLFAPDFDRDNRVQLWNRLGSLSPIVPGAG